MDGELVDSLAAAIATKQLSEPYDVLAPDTSEIRVLVATTRGSVAHGTLPPGRVSLAIAHQTVEEVWYVTEGQGQVWRKLGEREEVVDVGPGTSLTIPPETHFQFRSTGDEPLRFVMCTMPPWPGQHEAIRVPDHWPTGLPAADTALSVLDPSLYRTKQTFPSQDNPRQIVYEATSHLPHLGWGVAYADIRESVTHVHRHTREMYVHLEGPPLVVELGGEVRLLEVGDSLDIPVGVAHKARSRGAGPARIVVTSCPAWTAEDHHLLE